MKIRLRIFSLLLLFLIGLVSASIRDGDDDETFMVVRAHPNTTEQLDFVRDLHDNMHTYDLDFWLTPHLVGQMADVMVRESRLPWLKDRLGEMGISHFVSIPDVQKLIIDREQKSKNSKLSQLIEGFRKRYHDEGGNRAKYGFGDYHSYDTIIEWMNEIERQYPDRAKVITIGQTDEGRPIKTIKLGTNIHNTARKVIWMDGGIHAREWAAVHTTVYFIDRLIADYDTDPIVREAMDNLHFYVTPVLNPDGYEFSRTGVSPMIRLWRKNRSNMVCKKDRWFRDRCCGGVDLNRNFDWFWGEIGSSADKCSEIYQGSAVWSEAESRAVRDMVFSPELRGKIEAFITLHTYSQMWIHPFSHQRKTVPEDIAETEEVGRRAVAALEGMYGTKYRFGTGADILYPSAGGSDDWAKGKGGAKFVYLLELRPGEEVWDGFILDSRQLMPTAKETWAGVKVVIEAVNKRNRRAAPPMVATSSIFDKFLALKSFLVDVVKTLFTDSKKEETTTTTTTTTSVEPPTTEGSTTLRARASFEHFTRRLSDLTTTESTTLETTTEVQTTLSETPRTSTASYTTTTTVFTTERPLTLKFINFNHETPAPVTTTEVSTTTSAPVTESILSSSSRIAPTSTTSSSTTSTTTTATSTVATIAKKPQSVDLSLSTASEELTTTMLASSSTHTSSPVSTTTTTVISTIHSRKDVTVNSTSNISTSTTLQHSKTTANREEAPTTATIITSTVPPVEELPFSVDSTVFDVSSTASPSTRAASSTATREFTLHPSSKVETVAPIMSTPSALEVLDSSSSTPKQESTVVTTVSRTKAASEIASEPVYSTLPPTMETITSPSVKVIVWTISEPLEEQTTEEPTTEASGMTTETIASPSSKATPNDITRSTTTETVETTTTSKMLHTYTSSGNFVKPTITAQPAVPKASTARVTKVETATSPPVMNHITTLDETTVITTTAGASTRASTLQKVSEVILSTAIPTSTTTEQLPEEPLKSIQFTLFQEASPQVVQKTANISELLTTGEASLPESSKDIDEAFSIGQRVLEQLEKGLPEDMEQVEVSAAEGKEKEAEEDYEDSGETEETSDSLEVPSTTLNHLMDTVTIAFETTLTSTLASTTASQSTSAASSSSTTRTAALVTTVPSTTATTPEIITTASATTVVNPTADETISSTTSIPTTSTVEVTPNNHHLSIDDLEEEVLPPVIVTGVLSSAGLLAAKGIHSAASRNNKTLTLHPPPVVHHPFVKTLRSSAESSPTSKPTPHVIVPVHVKGNRHPPGARPQAVTPASASQTTSSRLVTEGPTVTTTKSTSTLAHLVTQGKPRTKPPVDPTLVALETHLELSVPPPPPTDEQVQVKPSALDHEVTTTAPTTKRRPTTRRKSTRRQHHRRTKKPRTNTKSPVSNRGHTTTARPGNSVAARRKVQTRHFTAPTTVATTTTSTTTTTTTEAPTTVFESPRLEIVRPRLGSRRNRTRPVLKGREETRVLLAERFRQQQARLEERRQEARRRGQSGSAVRVVSGNVENRTPVTESFQQPAPVFQKQPQQPQALCIDRSPWCGAWIHGNPSICQISSIYMRRDCARSCRYCS